jgi:hypothetical protein
LAILSDRQDGSGRGKKGKRQLIPR